MQTRVVNYKDGNQQCRGYLAFDESKGDQQPTVLIVHAFDGLDDFVKNYAHQVVEAGFAAFCLDMYGDGKVAKDLDSCIAEIMPFINDRAMLQRRVLAGFEAAKAQAEIDNNKIAAMGFCFGGMCVLDLARAGADVKGVASLHGVLAAPEKVKQGEFKAKVLILHGYDDPQVKPDQLQVLADELNPKNVDWQFMFFGHTKHAYTDPEAAKIGPPEFGREYNEASAHRAFQYSCDFFREVL